MLLEPVADKVLLKIVHQRNIVQTHQHAVLRFNQPRTYINDCLGPVKHEQV